MGSGGLSSRIHNLGHKIEVSGQLYDPAALSPGMITRYALCMSLGGRQNLPGRFEAEKILFRPAWKRNNFSIFHYIG